MRSLPFALVLLTIAACSDESSPTTSSPADGGTSPDGSSSTKDGGGIDTPEVDAGSDSGEPPLATQNEKEPNNGATATEIGAMTLPGAMKGAIDPANDRVMICGNPQMLIDLKAMLEARNFTEGSGGEPGEFVIEKAFVER